MLLRPNHNTSPMNNPDLNDPDLSLTRDPGCERLLHCLDGRPVPDEELALLEDAAPPGWLYAAQRTSCDMQQMGGICIEKNMWDAIVVQNRRKHYDVVDHGSW